MNLVPDTIDFKRYATMDVDKANVRSAASYADVVVDNFHGTASKAGVALPWDEGKAYVRLRPGKVSIWTGITHHGKSTALSHAMVYALTQGERVCIWSGEETPDVTLETMTAQATCDAEPSPRQIRQYLTHVGEDLWFYDQFGVVAAERLIGVMNYAASELKVTQFVIDSLMKTSVRGDDYDGQREFVNRLAAFARPAGCHVHIVAHMRKGKDESLGSIMDVKGGGDIIGQADNLFMVWKNKAKIDERCKSAPDPQIMSEPDTVFVVDKQRGRKTWTGKFNLAYSQEQMQFTLRSDVPKPYFRMTSPEQPL